MTGQSFALFDTAIGRCGIAWGARGICGVQLPEASEARTRARLMRRYPDAREALPPPQVRHAIEAIAALLAGQPTDLSAVALDMDDVPDFDRRVYEAARSIAADRRRSAGSRPGSCRWRRVPARPISPASAHRCRSWRRPARHAGNASRTPGPAGSRFPRGQRGATAGRRPTRRTRTRRRDGGA